MTGCASKQDVLVLATLQYTKLSIEYEIIENHDVFLSSQSSQVHSVNPRAGSFFAQPYEPSAQTCLGQPNTVPVRLIIKSGQY